MGISAIVRRFLAMGQQMDQVYQTLRRPESRIFPISLSLLDWLLGKDGAVPTLVLRGRN